MLVVYNKYLYSINIVPIIMNINEPLRRLMKNANGDPTFNF